MQRGLILSSSSTASSLRCCCRKSVIHQKKSKSSSSQHNALLVRRAALFPVILLVALPVSTPYHNEILLLVHDTMYLIISFFADLLNLLKPVWFVFTPSPSKPTWKKMAREKKVYVSLSVTVCIYGLAADTDWSERCYLLCVVRCGRLCDLPWILQHVS